MISVVLPTYNRGPLLMRAVSSVLNQTYSDIELLIVDDGSSDCTRDVVSKIDDPRVKYLYQDVNRGACAVRNIGVNAARGEYIAFQDSDDVWYPEKLEQQLAYLQETQSDVVFCAFFRYQDGEKEGAQFPAERVKSGRIRYETLLAKNLISTQTILGKRECFLAEPFNEQFPRLQDWELVLRLAKRYRMTYDNRPMVNVYLQRDSISASPQKGLWAIERLIDDHKDALAANSKAALGMANEYMHLARCCKRISREKAGCLLRSMSLCDRAYFCCIQAAKGILFYTLALLKKK